MYLRAMVLVGADGSIGQEGDQPIKLKEDLRTFCHYTSGSTVVSGRTTLQAIGKKLPNRTVIGMSKLPVEELGDVASMADHFVSSTDELIAHLSKLPSTENVWVIGGGQIYASLLELIDEFHVTEIEDYRNRNADCWLGGKPTNNVASLMLKLGFSPKPNSVIKVYDETQDGKARYHTTRTVYLKKPKI